MTGATEWLRRIRELPVSRPVRVMNVCGGHERSVTQSGMRDALRGQVEIIPGPGCPVCVCPEEDIYQAIQLALHERITLVAFGDMLRVPCNAPRREPRTLMDARAAGANVRPIATPTEARELALADPSREVVFFAAGFETTTAPVAAMLAEGAPENLSVLLSARLTWPAVAMLLDSGPPGFDCLIAPGHVATVMGPEEWSFVADRYGIPTAVAGFETEHLLHATWSVLNQFLAGKPALDNCYRTVVRPGGNPRARALLAQCMEVGDANWRGIGVIPNSGFSLNAEYRGWDARRRFTDYSTPDRRRVGAMPPGCDCASVVLGKLYPNQCRLFGRACVPRNPIGPCMVSDEGACRIWWAGGFRERQDRPPSAAMARHRQVN